MNMKRSVQIILLTLLAFASPVQAVKRYYCDFESEAMRNRWITNPTANMDVYNQLANKWFIGEPGNNDRNGHNGLFVSGDNGASATYVNRNCWIFAYDTVTLDALPTGEDYTLRFDYCVMANVASKFDGLYVFWVPDSCSVLSIATSSGTLPTKPTRLDDYVVRLQPNAGADYLNGTMTWKECAVKIPKREIDGKRHKLIFGWVNGSNLAQQPAAMVDNILITNLESCPQPTNLVVTQNGTTVSLEWQGTADAYEVSAYSYDGNSWVGPKIVTANQTNFTGLPIGQADFIVRARCDSNFFSLKTIESQLIYYPEQLCVDYLNLNNAVCYIDNSSPTNTLTFNDFKKVNPVDYGPSNISSRHVVHFDRTEYEPRTGNMAKTVPDGELASVRLGNWEANNHAERIEFSFDVDTIKYPVLLLKYMPLLEAPGHEDHENPRFKLDILIDGQSIGECGQADFNANNVMNGNVLKPEAIRQGWHITDNSIAQTSADIVWKEWTTVGVNLRNKAYAGKTLTARLTTHDCTFSAHCGYAYFTLGCSDGKLKGMKCGEINPEFEAPDGFDYRWAYAYNEKYRDWRTGAIPDQYILSTDQHFNAGMHDDSLYVVDCMFVQDHSCFFSLYASTLATNPISIMNEPKIYMNCRDSIYRVTFDASPSWVQEIDHVKGDTSVSKAYHIETYEWNIEGLPYGWSDEVSPTFDFPLTGGDYDVSLRTTCGTCDSVLHYHLHLDPLGATRQTQTFTLCDADRKGEGFKWAERTDTVYRTYGIVDSVNLISPVTTCDSIIYLELLEPNRVFEDTMLLPESLPFVYHGKTYGTDTKSLVDTVPDPDDCTKTWVLNLEIYESLIASMPSAEYLLCEGDATLTLVYDIKRGRSLRYTYTFDDPAIPSVGPINGQQPKGQYTIDIPIAPSVEPNIYTGSLFLADSLPEFSLTLPFTLSLRYASDVITQRWNDVLAIRNDSTLKSILGNNGYKYEFAAVEWYLNGQPIPEATSFNYFAGEGNQLHFGEPYQALLTRPNGVKVFTCEFLPTKVAAEVMDLPSLVDPNAPMHIKGRGTAYWYDMLGRRHQTQPYDDSDITTPGAKGYYLLILQSDEARDVHSVMVR